MTAYLGYDVLEIEPNRAGARSVVTRLANTLDNKVGARAVDDRMGHPVRRMTFEWDSFDRTDATALLTFLAARRGKAVPCWVPTWQDDLVLASNAIVGATTVAVTACGYTTHQYAKASRKHLSILSWDGTRQNRKVTGTSTSTPGVEELTVAALTGALTVGQTMISFLTLCRLREDSVKIAWHSTQVATCKLEFVELPGEVPT